MWLVWQILAVLSVNGYILASKHFGQQSIIKGHLAFVITTLLIGWTVTVAYTKTDFIKAYMIQNGLLPIIGILIGIFIFGETMSIYKWIGSALIAVGILLFCK